MVNSGLYVKGNLLQSLLLLSISEIKGIWGGGWISADNINGFPNSYTYSGAFHKVINVAKRVKKSLYPQSPSHISCTAVGSGFEVTVTLSASREQTIIVFSATEEEQLMMGQSRTLHWHTRV